MDEIGKSESKSEPESQSKDCLICFENINIESERIAILDKCECNRLLHYTCLQEWLDVKRVCPICHSDIGTDAIFSNYVSPPTTPSIRERHDDNEVEEGSQLLQDDRSHRTQMRKDLAVCKILCSCIFLLFLIVFIIILISSAG